MTTAWDIRLDDIGDSHMLDAKRGKWSQASGVRIRFRKTGSRGRFETVVVIDGLKGQDPQDIVTRYVAQMRGAR